MNGFQSSSTISRKLKAMGINVIKHPHKFKFNHKQVLNLYKHGNSIKNIVNIIGGSSQETISSLLKKNGFTITKENSVPKFDNTIFDSIDTEEKAYWLGFIFADGCVAKQKAKRNYAITIGLAIQDINHLYKFNHFVKYIKNNMKIIKAKPSNIAKNVQDKCVFSVSNKHLWETLNPYGCTPQKSLTLEFPDKNIFKSVDLIRHFIRGYIDGDG